MFNWNFGKSSSSRCPEASGSEKRKLAELSDGSSSFASPQDSEAKHSRKEAQQYYGFLPPHLEVHTLGFCGYTDAAFAHDTIDRRSTSGYLLKFPGGLVSWKSRTPTVTATSSTEAEYMGFSLAAKEAVWLQRLLRELDYLGSVVLLADNKPTISLTANPEHHSSTKYIEISWHFVSEQVQAGNIRLVYLKTEDMPADGLT